MCDTSVLLAALLVARQCSRTFEWQCRPGKWMRVTKAFSCCHSDHGHEKILIPSHVTHTGERDVKIFTDLAAIGVAALHVSMSPVW